MWAREPLSTRTDAGSQDRGLTTSGPSVEGACPKVFSETFRCETVMGLLLLLEVFMDSRVRVSNVKDSSVEKPNDRDTFYCSL